MTPAAAVDRLGQLAELGIDQHLFGMPADDPEAFEVLVGEVAPQVAGLVVAGR